jgi:hypothetical protein
MNADLFQQCLEDVLAGRKTLAQCLAEHPHERDLAAELRLALHLRQWSTPTLSETATKRIETQLRQRLRQQKAAAKPPRMGVALRWATGFIILVVVFLGSVGTVAASEPSLPGQPLYAVKRWSEAAQLAFTPANKRAQVYLKHAQRRATEWAALVVEGNAPELGDLAEDWAAATSAALDAVNTATAEDQADLLTEITQAFTTQETALANALSHVPPQAQSKVERAQTIVMQNHLRATEKLKTLPPGQVKKTQSAGTPNAIPPGQAKKTETVLPPGLLRQTTTPIPPGQIKRTETVIPAGQLKQTTTALPAAVRNLTTTPWPPGAGISGQAKQTKTTTVSESAVPTQCSTNSAGKSVCKP